MNYTFIVKEVADRVARRYDGGDVDQTSREQIPLLLQRIRELEEALTPFAHVGTTVAEGDLPMVQVYGKDCVRAFNMMDPNYSYTRRDQRPQNASNFAYPAENF